MDKQRPRHYTHIPFNPQKWPFYYGWWIIPCSIVGIVVSLPGQTMGFSAFTGPVLSALKLDAGYLSNSYAVGTIASGLSIAWAGKFYDVFGARVMAVCAAIGLGLVLVTLSYLEHIYQFVHYDTGVFFVILSTLFFLLRYFGQGSITLASQNIAMKWFDAYRGRVSAISGICISLIFSLGPSGFNALIEGHGWQYAWRIIAFTVGVGFPIFAWCFFRDNPDDCGLIIDGGRVKNTTISTSPETSWPADKATKTGVFWLYSLSRSLMGLYITGFTFHVAAIFENAGRDGAQAFSIFFPASVISVGVNIVGGWLSDRLELNVLLMWMLSGIALSLGGAIVLESDVGYWCIIVGNGISGGLFGVLSQVSLPRFFGTKHLGEISGKRMSLLVIGSAIGPPLFAKSKSLIGSYTLASVVCLGAVVTLLVWSLFCSYPSEYEEEVI